MAKINVDLTTLTNYSSLAEGTYTISVEAVGANYANSLKSAGVSFTKAPSFKQVYPTKSGDYTLLSNLDKSKVYSIKGNDGSDHYSKLSYNNTWQLGQLFSGQQNDFSIQSQTATSVTFYLNINGGAGFASWNDIIVVEGNNTLSASSAFNSYTAQQTLAVWMCFVQGTKITMADNTYKNVEDIEYGDEVKCFDFSNGKQTVSKIDWMIPESIATEYWKITLSDDIVLKLVGNNDKSHRLFNVTKQCFMYPQDFEKDDYTINENGVMSKIVSCELIHDAVRFYNISSAEHINVYANGILTSNRLNNRFEIKDFKFTNNQLMTDAEIEKYQQHLASIQKPCIEVITNGR